jgi:hypothetical protein
VSTRQKSAFQKVGECLYRYSSNGVYYARFENGARISKGRSRSSPATCHSSRTPVLCPIRIEQKVAEGLCLFSGALKSACDFDLAIFSSISYSPRLDSLDISSFRFSEATASPGQAREPKPLALLSCRICCETVAKSNSGLDLRERSIRGPVPFCHLRLFHSRIGKFPKAISPGTDP